MQRDATTTGGQVSITATGLATHLPDMFRCPLLRSRSTRLHRERLTTDQVARLLQQLSEPLAKIGDGLTTNV